MTAPVALAAPVGDPSVEASDPDAAEITADAKEQAKVLAQDGRQLYWAGDYEAAIEAFTAAHELVADPNLLFNISAAYEKLGDFERAIEYLDRYLPDAPPEERDGVAAKREELLGAAEAAAAPSPPEPESETGDPDQPEGPPMTPALDPQPAPPEKKLMGAAGWTLVGIAGVGLGVGAGFGGASLSQSNQARDACVDEGGGLRCPAGAEANLRAARRNAIVADVAFGVTAAAAVATIILIGVRLRARKKADARLSLAASGSGLGLRF